MRRVARFAALAFALAMPGGTAQAQEPPKSHPAVSFDARVDRWTVPAVRQWQAAPGKFMLQPASRIVLPVGADAAIREVALRLAADMQAIAGIRPVVSTGAPRPGDIVLALADPEVGSASNEAYRISVADIVTLEAKARPGLFYATQSLLQLLRNGAGGRELARGVAQDWPDYPQRAVMVDVGRKFFEVSELDKLMREMAWLKLNTLGLHFTDWPAFRLNSPKYPGLAARQSYTRQDVAHLEATARRYNITIIPEIDLPAHASALITYRPELGFRCEAMRQSPWLNRSAGDNAKNLAWTVDITREANRAWLRELLGEFIPWFSGPYFHIGGDEYQYDVDKNRCPELLDYAKRRGLRYAGDVFVDWINETNRFVRSQGKATAVWSWWGFKDDRFSIQPDRDILIYAWNSPRLNDILANGYKVLVTPEDKLYVVPGIENFDGGGYGVVDTEHVYTEMPFAKGANVTGYMVALWADAAEHRSDVELLARAYVPMAVLSERLWSGQGSASLDAFVARLNKASAAPRPDPVGDPAR